MKIAIAADHAGFVLKQKLRDELRAKGYEVVDFGTTSEESTDYPDYAAAVGHSVVSGAAERGILVCSSGVGMSMAANKIPGIRAALAANAEEVRVTREHNDANVLTLGARFTSSEEAANLVDIFLNTNFSGGERHARRIAKLARLERLAQEETIGK
ncbi:MAG: ribose 5-phosphate isomerase B [Bryobacteraceae bacterium]